MPLKILIPNRPFRDSNLSRFARKTLGPTRRIQSQARKVSLDAKVQGENQGKSHAQGKVFVQRYAPLDLEQEISK